MHISPAGNSIGVVSLSVNNAIPGATVKVSPSSGIPTFSSVLSIVTSSATPAGSYCVLVTGVEGNVIHTATYLLVVTSTTQSSFTGSATAFLFGAVMAGASGIGVGMAIVANPGWRKEGYRLFRSAFRSIR